MNYAYIRVSGTRQELSLEDQQARIRRYAEYKGIEVDNWFIDEHVSGGRIVSSRPQGHALCCALEENDTVLFTQLDRVFRDLADGILMEKEWSKKLISLVAVDDGGQAIDTSTVTGWLCFTQRLMYAEMERRLASERTKKIKSAAALRGEHVSGVAKYGYNKVKVKNGRIMLEPNEREQAVISLILDMRKQGMGWADISRELNKERIRTKQGHKWTSCTVSRLVNRIIREEKARQQAKEHENTPPT